MILTIWRHGEAGRAATDRQRELTDRGQEDVGFGCRQFHEALDARGIPAPELILYSPWVRTWQTAEIVASGFSHAAWREHPALQPGGTVTSVEHCLDNQVQGAADQFHVVLVSHQPLVSELVDHYLGPAAGVPSLPPGALVTLSLDTLAQGCGSLVFWAAPPEYEAGL